MLVFLLTALAADPNLPHEHQGVIAAYKGAPPAISLSETDLATLTAGQQVQKQFQVGNGGRAAAIMDIAASTDKVWSKILSFSSYPSWVENVSACEVYKTEGSNIYARFLLSVMGMSVEYYIKHTLNKAAGYMTWTLDYSRQSDLDDSVGFWRVTALSSAKTRVEYSVEIRFKSWIPGFVADMIRSQGLTSATSWVKKQSEG
jgi:ribosome-associated toxin RatA of RatAB toxin-antitoxin module